METKILEPKVNILLSAYNGEKYIEEQLQSLLGQGYPRISIYVRDDGSADGTLRVLQPYVERGEITLIKGKNIGFCASFFELMKAADEGDYWSFCDQDDIWAPDKVESAVNWLKNERQDIPLLYHSAYEMIDEQGGHMGQFTPPPYEFDFRTCMTGTIFAGFSTVVNRPLRDKMLLCNPYECDAHDWLAGAIAFAFGKTHLDMTVRAKYRRLAESVSRVSFARRMRWLVQSFRQSNVKRRNMEFSRVFYTELDTQQQKILSLFNHKRYNFAASLKKAFYGKRWRPSISSELSMRLLMLLGKV